jgi:DNA polymerase elongation subunit (family B)
MVVVLYTDTTKESHLSKFYTYASLYKGKIHHRYVEDGTRKTEVVTDITPTAYFGSSTPTPFTTLMGGYVKPVTYHGVFEAREAIKRMDGMSNSTVYGTRAWDVQWRAEQYSEDVKYDVSKILIFFLDIECGSAFGFPDPMVADQPLTAITIYHSIQKKYYTFSYVDFNNIEKDVVYVKCADEKELITRFISFWRIDYPDIVSGWYSNGFDMPYIYNRIKNVFGEKTLSMLSPFGYISDREVGDDNSKRMEVYIEGVELLDYQDLYKKYSAGNEESYKLAYIAQKELGETKIEYEGTLTELWENDPQLYIEYNIQDVRLLVKLDAKLNMMFLQLDIAYMAKVNYTEAMSPVRLWSALIYNDLIKDNIIMPPDVHRRKEFQYEGAYVKDMPAGVFKWVSTVDAASLYPSMIITFNISPETQVAPSDVPEELLPYYRHNIVDLLSSWTDVSDLTDMLKAHNMTIAANGQLYYREKQGILPKLMKSMLDTRKISKKEMLKLKQEKELTKAGKRYTELETQIRALSIREQGLKTVANAGYGVLGSEYFSLFDTYNAEAITLSGKVSNLALQYKLNEFINTTFKRSDNHDWVLGGDTDSLFLHLEPFIDKFKPDDPIDFLCKLSDGHLAKLIDGYCDEIWSRANPVENRLSFKREKIISSIVFIGKKKRYFSLVHDSEGTRYAEPDFPITGFETNRSSTPKFCRDSLRVAFRMIVDHKQDELYKYVAEIENQFNALPVNDISFPRGITDMMKYYNEKTIYISKTPQANRAALMFNHHLKLSGNTNYPTIKSGDKIKYCYMKPNPTHEDVFGWPDGKFPKEFGLEKFVDRRLQFEKSFLVPLKNVTDAIGWHTEKQNEAMGDFFG